MLLQFVLKANRMYPSRWEVRRDKETIGFVVVTASRGVLFTQLESLDAWTLEAVAVFMHEKG